jgi:hypothetical protein
MWMGGLATCYAVYGIPSAALRLQPLEPQGPTWLHSMARQNPAGTGISWAENTGGALWNSVLILPLLTTL